MKDTHDLQYGINRAQSLTLIIYHDVLTKPEIVKWYYNITRYKSKYD